MVEKRITSLSDLKKRFHNDRDATLRSIYNWYRDDFILFAKSYTRSSDSQIDAFQEAIVALHHNLINDKIYSDQATVKTYLFEIGRRLILNMIKKDSRLILVDDPLHFVKDHIDLFDDREDRLDMIKQAVKSMGTTCQELLRLFYYKNYSIEAIMNTLNMKNENSVKANKSRCIRNLKELIKENHGK